MSLKTKGFSRKTEALKLIGGGENRTGLGGKLVFIDKSMPIFHSFTQFLRSRLGETGTKFFESFLFSIKMRQKSLVSQHFHDASKQVVVTEIETIVFEADALKHFLVHKPLDLSG